MADQQEVTSQAWRTEQDSLGQVMVPAERYWGAQTERARQQFRLGDDPVPKPLILSLIHI